MADAPARQPAPSPATVADVMHPAVTMVEQNGHVAAAAYLMKRAEATALIVTQQSGEPIGIITEADISQVVADGKNPNDVRIYELMTGRPTVVSSTASIRDAAKVMIGGRFRHLPVMGEAGLVGIVDITDITRALLQLSEEVAAAEEPPPAP